MVDIFYLLRDLWITRDIQEWINHRYKKAGTEIICLADFKSIETIEGIKFLIDDQLSTISEVVRDYKFDDIRQDDIVIDIGANIGGFALRAAKYTPNVYAVEPVMSEHLRRNVEINNLNVKIIEAGIGKSGTNKLISYGGKSKTVPLLSFSEIFELAGGCNFLKCDCEGCELLIPPEEFTEIRRIEMEIHYEDKEALNTLINHLRKHHSLEFQPHPGSGIIHATKKD